MYRSLRTRDSAATTLLVRQHLAEPADGGHHDHDRAKERDRDVLPDFYIA